MLFYARLELFTMIAIETIAPLNFSARCFAAMVCGLLAFVCFTANAAQAQQPYPNRPIRIIVPLAPGGAGDIAARLFGQKLGDAFNQQVVIDNRPGAGGIIGADLAAKAAPDGYTLVLVGGNHTIFPSLHKKMPYDMVTDFAPVSMLAAYPHLLVVNPALPIKSVKDLIALTKTKPGQINFSSGGNGSTAHMTAELFKSSTGINVVHVPYKGATPALVAVVAGEAGLAFYSASAAMQYVKPGRLRALATTGEKRSPSIPDLPTVAESGVPGFETTAWSGLLAPAGTPTPVITKLFNELARILQIPEAKERLAAIDFEPVGNSPEAFAAYIRKDIQKWAKVVKDSGAKAD